MDEVKNRKTTRLLGADYNSAGVYFITICTKDRRQILSNIVGTGVPDGPSVKLLPHGRIADKFINQLNDFYDNLSVENYVIMPNHIHILLFVKESGPSRTPVPTTTQNSTVSRFISTFKRFCNKEYGYNIWQYRSHDHIIRNKEDLEKHLKYIHENPTTWIFDEFYSEETD